DLLLEAAQLDASSNRVLERSSKSRWILPGRQLRGWRVGLQKEGLGEVEIVSLETRMEACRHRHVGQWEIYCGHGGRHTTRNPRSHRQGEDLYLLVVVFVEGEEGDAHVAAEARFTADCIDEGKVGTERGVQPKLQAGAGADRRARRGEAGGIAARGPVADA